VGEDRGRVGEDRGSKETDGCPLTLRRKLVKRRALSFEQLLHQVETIIIDLLI
jgi:hypothetical protein